MIDELPPATPIFRFLSAEQVSPSARTPPPLTHSPALPPTHHEPTNPPIQSSVNPTIAQSTNPPAQRRINPPIHSSTNPTLLGAGLPTLTVASSIAATPSPPATLKTRSSPTGRPISFIGSCCGSTTWSGWLLAQRTSKT